MAKFVRLIGEAFQYEFMRNALIAGIFISVCCSFLGVFLVLKKLSLIGDGLAHVSLAAVALGLLFSVAPLFLTVPIVILASFGIIKLNEKASLHGDAAIGLVSSIAVALGVLIASAANGFNVDFMSYLFGSILVTSRADVIVSVLLSIAVIVIVLFFYKSLFAISYDEEYARISNIPAKRLNHLMIMLTAVTISIGIRVVGTLLISSLIIFPAVSALQVARSFRGAIVTATIISAACVFTGVIFSYVFNLPTGALIVMLNGLCFTVLFIARKIAIRRN